MAFKRILVAIDRSPMAAHAADIGAELAGSLGAELAFVHAVDPANEVVPVDSGVPANELLTLAEHDARTLLTEFRAGVSSQVTTREFLAVGKPAAEIVKAAKAWPADLVLIGSHGRTGVERVLLGSVAEWVVRHAPCPILVVRATA